MLPAGITISSPLAGTPDGLHEAAVVQFTVPATDVFVTDKALLDMNNKIRKSDITLYGVNILRIG